MPIAVRNTISRAAEGVLAVVLDQPSTLGDSDCEALHSGFFSQPINTLTSMSYAAGGIWAATRIGSLRREQRLAASTYSALMVFNGVGSVAYHGPQFPGAQTLHDLPVLGLVGFGAAVPIWRKLRGHRALPGWSNRRIGVIGVASTVAAVSYVEGRTASRVCDPNSWVQFHGLWHISTAVAMTMWSTILWPPELAATGTTATEAASDTAGTAISGVDDE
ncbi:MAG TPA: hypothetical protein VL068_12745 [Microthrixaceae bacterium]|nr:hypothetical protein [Microthrixaceae bacterium]